MNPTRGNSSPKWNPIFATTRRAFFQLAAWERKPLYQATGLWLGLPTGRVSNSAMSRARFSLAGMRMAYFTPRPSSASAPAWRSCKAICVKYPAGSTFQFRPGKSEGGQGQLSHRTVFRLQMWHRDRNSHVTHLRVRTTELNRTGSKARSFPSSGFGSRHSFVPQGK